MGTLLELQAFLLLLIVDLLTSSSKQNGWALERTVHGPAFLFIVVEAAKLRRQKNSSYLLDLCRTHLHLLDSTLFYGYTFEITGFLVQSY